MAEQLIVDLYGCDAVSLNEADRIREIAHEAVHSIGAEIVIECVHQFEPVGVSYIAVITTSHISIHTWPEYGYAAADVFSCGDGIPEALAQALGKAFGAQKIRTQSLERDLKGGSAT